MRKIILLSMILVFCAQQVGAQQDRMVRSTFTRFEGSAPPLPHIYRCIRTLEGRRYSETETKSCIDRIQAEGRFISCTVESRLLDDNSIELDFHVKSPSLKIETIDYELDQRRKDELQAFLQEKNQAIRLGDIYDSDRMGLLRQYIEQFFASEERHEGISSEIELDYRSLTARISYRFYDGPKSPKEGMLFEDNRQCTDQIKELNMTDIDDYVPVPFVEDKMTVRGFSCFDLSLAREDELTLRRTGLFRSVDLHVNGEVGGRSVMVEIHGKPLTVNRVRLIAYGLADSATLDSAVDLPLQPKSIYKNSIVRETSQYLLQRFRNIEREVDVIPDVLQVDENTVEVDFSVLVYDRDQLLIDGELVHIGSGPGSY